MKINIRRIEEKDKGEYLKLYSEEDYGCIGILSDLKPSVYSEEAIVTKIISKEIIDIEVLVIEVDGIFAGYASISRPSATSYHIGHLAIKKSQRGNGYGTLLMNRIKEYASGDKSDIKLECIGTSRTFFIKCGFDNIRKTKFLYKNHHTKESKESLFVDYELIEQERKRKDDADLQSFKKFLKSSLFKDLSNML